MEIPNELLKMARMKEPKPTTVKLLDTPTIDLQHPNPYPLPHTSKVVGTIQTKIIDSNFPVTGPYPGIVGTSTLNETLKIKKENLEIQNYLHEGDLAKQTPPPAKPSRKVIHSSAKNFKAKMQRFWFQGQRNPIWKPPCISIANGFK